MRDFALSVTIRDIGPSPHLGSSCPAPLSQLLAALAALVPAPVPSEVVFWSPVMAGRDLCGPNSLTENPKQIQE